MIQDFILIIGTLYLILIPQANQQTVNNMIKMFFTQRLNPVLFALIAVFAMPANAVLEIDITEGVIGGIPIAVVPFLNSQSVPQDVSSVISSDLARSGRFDVIPETDFLNRPTDARDVSFKDWRLLKADALVVGKILPSASGYQVSFQLMDVGRGLTIEGRSFNVPGNRLRVVGHHISDIIYQAMTGKPGAFNTWIAYVTKSGSKYELQIADSDGYDPQSIRTSSEPIIATAWSPDGRKVAYVELNKGRSTIWIQDLAAGQRRAVAQFKGNNSSPAFSPDGRRLAMSLSKDGNPEIYVMDLATSALTRITRDRGIDTEPSWSPDGRSLLFTSGRSGKPQIYKVSAAGGSAQRVTFQGKYNAKASYSPDGTKITLITNQGQGDRIGLLDLKTGVIQQLTKSDLDESPSFALNGEMVLYATKAGGSGVLSVVSDLGRVAQTLRVQQGDVREPAWSPVYRKL